MGPESPGVAASRVPSLLPLPPSPPPLCRAPTLSRLSPGAGARGRAGGGARAMGRRARARLPAPAGLAGGARGSALGVGVAVPVCAPARFARSPWLRPPEPGHYDWYPRTCFRPVFLQSRNRMHFLARVRRLRRYCGLSLDYAALLRLWYAWGSGRHRLSHVMGAAARVH